MSKLLRCNRCGQEQELREVVKEDNAVVRMSQALTGMADIKSWTHVRLASLGFPLKPPTVTLDLCEDCREVFTEQFMVGARVEAITQPVGQNILPHDNVPYQDCLLAFDPEKGGFICEHDDPERFLKLQRDRAQNVAEGVPEQIATPTEGVPTIQDWADKKRRDMDRQLQDRIGQLASDVETAGVAHAVPVRCSHHCSEQHTYLEGCLLEGVVRKDNANVPGQIMPPACGPECGETAPDGSMPNPHHTYNLGTCLMNRDTAQAVLVVCPVCKDEGSMSGIVMHMAEHGYAPDYVNHQWVDARGYNLDGRLISQQGEDLTEAYAPQEPVQEGE